MGRGWPLALLLAVQAALTLRLVWSNTAFADEALYVSAGRLELAHLLTGSPVPDYARYFSGAPALYPPLGAIAAGAGGLAAARLLSTAMMLTATGLLHGLTRRLFDRRSAFFAAALFAGLGGTQFLGALATYDALALCLLALGAWLAVIAASRAGPDATRLAVAAGVAVAVANATKYASGLFDPVVLGIAVLAVWPARGRSAALRAGATVAAALAAVLAAAALAGGAPYLHGLLATTLDRPPGGFPAARLLVLSGAWLWVVAAPAALGLAAAVTARRGRQFALLGVVLFAALLLAPAEQAYIHTYTSLYKHDAYGAWFGCALAGYAVAALSRVVPAAKAIAAFRVGVIAVAAAAVPGIPAATAQYHGWPDSTALIAAAKKVITTHPGPILADDGGALLNFYLGPQVSRVPVDDTFYISYRGPGQRRPEHGLAGYADAIRHRYFAVVVLQFTDNQAVDGQIWHDLSTSGNYHLPPGGSVTYFGTRQFLIYVRNAR
jgi:4-amino-4-deoxy-L-arabinose transferase-like glycosyltransferase